MKSRLTAQIRALAGQANEIVAAADREDRVLTTDEYAKVQALLSQCAEHKSNLDKATKVTDALAGLSHIGHDDSPKPAARPVAARGRSLGQSFVESDEYKDMLKTRGAEDAPWNKRRVNSSPISVEGAAFRRPRNDLVTGTSPELAGDAFGENTTAGVLVQPEFAGMLPATYARELVVRDLLTTVPTSSDTIDYVKVDTVTNRASAVPEATSSASDETAPLSLAAYSDPATNPGGFKPESALTFTEQREHVRTIAHTMPVTKKALADAPQVRVIIDVFLRYGLDEKVEDLILTGDGSGENFTGLLDASRAQSAPGVLDGVQVFTGVDDQLDKAKKAKTRSRLARGGRPTAYLMHPLTWEKYELDRDGDDRHRAGGPFDSGDQSRLWGLPVVESEAMPEDTVVTGNFRQAVYYDRQQAALSATDSHEDFFIRNLVMILAEVRGGFALLHPSTFVVFNVNPESA